MSQIFHRGLKIERRKEKKKAKLRTWMKFQGENRKKRDLPNK